MRDGAWLIAWGLFQKIFVADNLAPLANAVFDAGHASHRHQRSAGGLRVRVSDLRRLRGVSNIARGVSKLMGIELLENFRFPYFVRITAGILAPLAHQPVHLAAGLSVHPAWRQPRPRLADESQPADHDGPRGVVARRRLDVRAVGRFPWRPADRLSPARRHGRSQQRWLLGPSAYSHTSLGWVIMFHATCSGLADLPRPLGGAARRRCCAVSSSASRPPALECEGCSSRWRCTPRRCSRACVRSLFQRCPGRAEAADRRAILCLRRHVLSHHAVR